MRRIEKLNEIIPAAQGRLLDALKAREYATQALADAVENGGASKMALALTRYRITTEEASKLGALVNAAEAELDDEGRGPTEH